MTDLSFIHRNVVLACEYSNALYDLHVLLCCYPLHADFTYISMHFSRVHGTQCTLAEIVLSYNCLSQASSNPHPTAIKFTELDSKSVLSFILVS